MRKTHKAALTALFVLASGSSAQAANRLNYYSGIIPPSQWYNLQQRYERLAEGAFKTAIFSTSGSYENLSVQPTSPASLSVVVGPANASTVGSLYQFLADDTSTFPQNDPINKSYELPADPTTITLQGTAVANSNAIGPLPVPGSNSQISLIECQVVTSDINTVNTNFISQLGTLQPETVQRDRADQISCQYKAGTPSASPTVPTVDSGWLAVGYVTIPSGTSTITTGMITASPAQGHAVMDGAASTQTIKGSKTFSLTIASLSTTPLTYANSAGSSSTTYLRGDAGFTVQGITDTVVGIQSAPTGGVLLALDATGTMGLAGSFKAAGSVVAGSTTAPSVSSGDLAASRSTTTGVIKIGGSSSSCAADYGVSTASTLTIPCATTITSTLAATSSGSTASYVPPIYTTAGAAVNSTMHGVVASGTCSASSSTAGPFTGYVATVSLTNAAQFSSVSTSATSFDVGGGAALAGNNYWLHDFGSFAVEWNSTSTIYVQCVGASQPYHFLAVGY